MLIVIQQFWSDLIHNSTPFALCGQEKGTLYAAHPSAVETAEKVMVESPEPEALVNVPEAPGAPVPEQTKIVPEAIVIKTVNVCPLLVNVAPTVALADVTVNV